MPVLAGAAKEPSAGTPTAGIVGRAMPVQSAPCGSLTDPLPVADGISAVLDIDSTSLATFDATDALWLEKICGLL